MASGSASPSIPIRPLLYVLRNDLGLKGTRASCVKGQCMSCTVLIDGRAVTASLEPVGAVARRNVETVRVTLRAARAIR